MNNEEENFAPPEITQKRLLQKVSKVVAITCLITAICCAIYMLFFIGENEIMKASLGATTFFCFMVALVLNTIADTNLPNMTIPKTNPQNSHGTTKNTKSNK